MRQHFVELPGEARQLRVDVEAYQAYQRIDHPAAAYHSMDHLLVVEACNHLEEHHETCRHGWEGES
jgi:hypothetical protein